MVIESTIKFYNWTTYYGDVYAFARTWKSIEENRNNGYKQGLGLFLTLKFYTIFKIWFNFLNNLGVTKIKAMDAPFPKL